EPLDASDDILGPRLRDPMDGEIVRGLRVEHRFDVFRSDALSCDRRQLEPLSRVDHVVAELMDPVAQLVGSREVLRRPFVPTLLGEPAGFGLAHPRCLRTKPRTAPSASSARSEWYRCPAPSRRWSSAPGIRSARM